MTEDGDGVALGIVELDADGDCDGVGDGGRGVLEGVGVGVPELDGDTDGVEDEVGEELPEMEGVTEGVVLGVAELEVDTNAVFSIPSPTSGIPLSSSRPFVTHSLPWYLAASLVTYHATYRPSGTHALFLSFLSGLDRKYSVRLSPLKLSIRNASSRFTMRLGFLVWMCN